MERWTHPTNQHTITVNNNNYNTVDDDQKEYEDPDYYYGGRRSGAASSEHSTHQMVKSPPPPGGAPPPTPLQHPMGTMGASTMGRGVPTTHLAIHHNANKTKQTARWKVMCTALVLGAICLVLVSSIIAFIVLGSRVQNIFEHRNDKSQFALSSESVTTPDETNRFAELEISPNHLLTLLITKRKLCLFEAATDDSEESLDSFLDDHIESAQLLYHSNLSHTGVPVHPLQFQRVARSLGIDRDCHVVIYDRGHVIWSTYAVWIFKLFGHNKVSLLSGGYTAWKSHQSHSAQYRTEPGPSSTHVRQGGMIAAWNNSVVTTFDDVFTNTELGNYDVVDAQTKEEYDGTATGALYGHIRDSINIPIEIIYDWNTGRWLTSQELVDVLRTHGLSRHRPVIVYCSTSVRASMIWWILNRQHFNAKIYFGGWPEWVIRAPDYLKILART